MMKKSKLGISVGFLSVVCFLAGYFNIFTLVGLVLVAIIMNLEDEVKVNAAQALIFQFAFKIFMTVSGLISYWYLQFLINLSKDSYSAQEASATLAKLDLFGYIVRFSTLIELVITILFVLVAIKGEIVRIPYITNMVCKHLYIILPQGQGMAQPYPQNMPMQPNSPNQETSAQPTQNQDNEQ